MNTLVSMRKDLAKQLFTIPAGLSYSDYDELAHDFYLSANDLNGAILCPEDQDHSFCRVLLLNGDLVYMHSIDLDFKQID